MKFTNFLYLFSFAMLFLVVGCDDDDPTPENEEELITNLAVSLVGSDGSNVNLTFIDPDGDGGTNPVIMGGTLSQGVTYQGIIVLSNPEEDITAEIKEEDDEHQFFYATSGFDATFNYTDQDDNNNPVGLTFRMEPTSTGQGTFRLTLRHEPNKNADGVSDGNIANAGGSTDIEVDFPITVQ